MISIIKQIQASITGEAKWRRSVWWKCKRKAKDTNIHGKSQAPPQTKPLGLQTPPPPRKLANEEASRGLVKISTNCLRVYVSHLNIFILYMVSQEGCLIPLWETGFLAIEMALVLSHMRETLSKITPKSLMVCTIHRIWEPQLHTQPLWWIVQLKIIFKKTSVGGP
jgi:hypothetical protein